LNSLELGTIIASLLLYSSFDLSFTADFAKGDKTATVENYKYPPVITDDSSGRFGEAAVFDYGELDLETVWTKDVVRYKAKGNFPGDTDCPFDGAIGMWIKIDMETLMDRELIWLDPFHLLTENRSENRDNGKIWMDFVTKELPGSPIFRFGATLPRHARKNPEKAGEGTIITIPGIDFSGKEWHHLIGTWNNLNNSSNTGEMIVYFDGKKAGTIQNYSHPISFDMNVWEIRIGIGFKGMIDEFFILDKFVTQDEAKALFESQQAIQAYLEK